MNVGYLGNVGYEGFVGGRHRVNGSLRRGCGLVIYCTGGKEGHEVSSVMLESVGGKTIGPGSVSQGRS